VIGGGIVGLSLSIELRKRGAQVLVVERGEPCQEASRAAAGMLADSTVENPALRTLASASANMYPEFVHELQDESGVKVDLRKEGTIVFSAEGSAHSIAQGSPLPAPLTELEPALASSNLPATYLEERSVDPRALTAAALKAARHRGVDISSGTAVTSLLVADGQAIGVKTDRTSYSARRVVNCAGAWAGQVPPHSFPTRPVKGQMLAVVGAPAARHVVRAPDVYLVPRSDGRLLIGASVEEAGFDKRTNADVIRRMQEAAVQILPGITQARLLEAWAGLRPGTPDALPLLGETSTEGYFVAAGHFRDGILLAPVTAHVMAQVVNGEKPDYDISTFSPARFLS